MAATKIALIGAGSISFAIHTIRDLTHARTLEGSTLVLNDVDRGKLDIAEQLARKVFEQADMKMEIEATTDHRSAARDAEFVILSVSRDRFPTWQKDLEIPRRYGIEQVLGENGGPGGLSHGLRSVYLCVDICRKVAEVAPHALVLNYTNPMSKVSLGIRKYTGLRTAGLCHQVIGGRMHLGHMLGMDQEQIDLWIGGVNHFSWALRIEDKRTGENLYPALRARVEDDPEPDFQPLSKQMFRFCGIWPLGGDSHMCEYVGYVHRSDFKLHQRYHLKPISGFEGHARNAVRVWQDISNLVEGGDMKEFLSERSIEAADLIIKAIVDRNSLPLVNANLYNEGYITNLPEECVVEVPAIADGFGVHGLVVGDLAPVPAALCHIQAIIQRLTVEAAVEGDRSKALQALMIDPYVQSLDHAEQMLDNFLHEHRDYLPQFN